MVICFLGILLCKFHRFTALLYEYGSIAALMLTALLALASRSIFSALAAIVLRRWIGHVVGRVFTTSG